jgi:hypothetical protein
VTKSLKKAFEAASKLPEAEQDAVAAAIFEELEFERSWDELFQRSADALAKLPTAPPGLSRSTCRILRLTRMIA